MTDIRLGRVAVVNLGDMADLRLAQVVIKLGEVADLRLAQVVVRLGEMGDLRLGEVADLRLAQVWRHEGDKVVGRQVASCHVFPVAGPHDGMKFLAGQLSWIEIAIQVLF